MKRINNMKEMFNYLDSINNINDFRYDDCKNHSYLNVEDYEKILNKILKFKEKPKRVIDIGSNMNQYAYLFENNGIDYIGIDLWNADRIFKPYESEHTKFIGARYEDISEWFKDDVIISNLCVDYLVDKSDIKAKHLITSKFNKETQYFEAKLWW